MTQDEKDVLAAVVRFYEAIEAMISGKGLDAMRAAWHHAPDVSTAHPAGTWAHGWEEVDATWEVFASFGKPENAGTRIGELKVHVQGDVGWVTGVFTAAPSFGSVQMNITDVLARRDGAWKIVHHHADKTPSMEKDLERMADEG
jgi:ketosteroid isomerase-like protein